MDRKLFRFLLCEIIEANISPVKSISFRYGMSFTGRYFDLREITVHLLQPLKKYTLPPSAMQTTLLMSKLTFTNV